MSSSSKLNKSQRKYIESNATARVFEYLPNPKEEWTAEDVHPELASITKGLHKNGIIEKVGERKIPKYSHEKEVNYSKKLSVWRTREAPWKAIQHARDNSNSPLPCACKTESFKNVGGEKPIQCRDCERRFKKSEVDI